MVDCLGSARRVARRPEAALGGLAGRRRRLSCFGKLPAERCLHRSDPVSVARPRCSSRSARHAHYILLIHSFDALRNRCEWNIGNALAAQSPCRPDQKSGNAVTEPATLDPHSAIALPLRARRKYGMTRSSDRRKFEPNTAISGKQFYPEAPTLHLSTRDRCELFAPCSLRRSSRNQTSSQSVSLGLGIRPVAFCHRPFFCLEYAPSTL